MFTILIEIVFVFGAALAVLSVSYRLRVPPIIGFLLAGVLIGPSGLALVPNSEHVESFAELAVVLMLFVIGLELSRVELAQLGRVLLAGGLMQCLTTATLATLAARFLGAGWSLAVFCGFVVALSSTAIVLKLHGDRRESSAPHGRLSLAILLFQDLLVVPMLLVVPILASGAAGAGTGTMWTTVARSGQGLLVVGAVFLVARIAMPKLLGRLAGSGIHELLILAALFVCCGAALLTHHLGLSMALGGFLAGVALADSDLRYQIQAEVAPFEDVFGSIFFTSIGMLLPLGVLREQAVSVVGLTLVIVVVKASIVLVAARLLGYPLRTALLTALVLSQIGEFSFVLLQVGSREGLVSSDLYGLLIATSVLSMLLTPFMVALAGPLSRWLESSEERGAAPAAERPRGHTVIGGCGVNGRHIARILKQAGKHYEMVDMAPALVPELRAEGHEVLLGDISRREVQLAAGVDQASVLVLALSDRDAARRAVRTARELQPSIRLVARAEDTLEMKELLRLGADEVVSEDLEASVELTRRVLESLAVPRQAIRSAIALLKEHHYEALLSVRPRVGVTETLLDVLTAGTAETFVLHPSHWAVGRSIAQLDLRRRTGATILGVIRSGEVIAHPTARLELGEGDGLVLAGDHACVEQALGYFERPAAD